MKKTLITIAIVLGIALGASAQDKGLFGLGPQRGGEDYAYTTREEPMINLPGSHGSDGDVTAPLGGGALLLIGFGAAYAMKKRKEQ